MQGTSISASLYHKELQSIGNILIMLYVAEMNFHSLEDFLLRDLPRVKK